MRYRTTRDSRIYVQTLGGSSRTPHACREPSPGFYRGLSDGPLSTYDLAVQRRIMVQVADNVAYDL